MGIMEKKMETTIMGLLGFRVKGFGFTWAYRDIQGLRLQTSGLGMRV